MASCGVRETIKFLCKHKMVDVIVKGVFWLSVGRNRDFGTILRLKSTLLTVASAGGVEEDFIKCLAPTYIGKFNFDGRDLRKRGMNRIGNLLVPNDNYCKFETWVMPILDQLVKEQKEQDVNWTPSKIINRLGKEINNEEVLFSLFSVLKIL